MSGGETTSIVYKVHKNANENELKDFIISKGFTVVQFVCVSHDEAKYKSFKLSVPKDEFSRLLDGGMWPENILVRKFKSRQ